MQRDEQAARWLQLLNGKKLHVLMALYVLRPSLPVGEREIASLLGCHRQTAVSALRSLMRLGLVAHGPYKSKASWTLTQEAHQLPFPFNQVNPGTAVTVELNDEMIISSHCPSSTSSSSSNEYSKNKILEGYRSEEEEERTPDEVIISPHRQPDEVKNSSHRPKSPRIDKDLKEWLTRAGVWRSRWAEVAGLEWVTVEFVKAHVLKGERDGEPQNWVVNRIIKGDPPPLICPSCSKIFEWERPYRKHVSFCNLVRR